jgi:hypothetical protein
VGDLCYVEGFDDGVKINGTTQMVAATPTPTTFTFLGFYATAADATAGSKIYPLTKKVNFAMNPVTNLDGTFIDNRYFLVERFAAEGSATTFSKEGITGNWHTCREVGFQDADKVTDPASIEYATKRNPVYHRDSQSGSITVYPTPDTLERVRVWGLPIQSIIYNTDPDTYNHHTSNRHWPKLYWPALQYYCISEAAMELASKSTVALSTLSWSDPTVVTRLADTPPGIPSTLAGTITAAPPAYNKPTISSISLTEMQNFLDADDSEMALATANKIQNEISQYQQDIANETAEWTAQFNDWQKGVDFEIKHSELDMQGLIAQYTNEVQRYQTNVAQYTQEVQNQLGKLSNHIQKLSAEVTAYNGIAGAYAAKFQNFMMSRIAPPAKPKKGDTDAG